MQRYLSNQRAATWSAIITLSATLLVPGCRDGQGLIEPPTAIPLLVSGHMKDAWTMTSSSLVVQLNRAGAAVPNAVVSANGVNLQHYGGSSPLYSAIFPELAAGSAVNLKVSTGGATIEATGIVPDRPALTSPATGRVFAPTDTITFAWTSATDPDRFAVEVTYFDNWGAIYGKRVAETPGTARELTLSASNFLEKLLPETFIVAVVAIKDDLLSFTGPVDPDSRVGSHSRSGDAVIMIRH